MLLSVVGRTACKFRQNIRYASNNVCKNNVSCTPRHVLRARRAEAGLAAVAACVVSPPWPPRPAWVWLRECQSIRLQLMAATMVATRAMMRSISIMSSSCGLSRFTPVVFYAEGPEQGSGHCYDDFYDGFPDIGLVHDSVSLCRYRYVCQSPLWRAVRPRPVRAAARRPPCGGSPVGVERGVSGLWLSIVGAVGTGVGGLCRLLHLVHVGLAELHLVNEGDGASLVRAYLGLGEEEHVYAGHVA